MSTMPAWLRNCTAAARPPAWLRDDTSSRVVTEMAQLKIQHQALVRRMEAKYGLPASARARAGIW